MPSQRHGVLVSFSGVDGSGKSTQIQLLIESLTAAGMRVRLLAFWDDVAVLRSVRETSSHKLFQSEPGIGAPDKPVNRRDKNVRHWFMTPIRFFLYFLDALRLRRVVASSLQTDADVVVFDRYLYDELANLDLNGKLSRLYARFISNLVPRPDVPNLLDADPAEARKRKPEYPLEFIRSNRASYLTLSGLAGMNVIEAGNVLDVHRLIMQEVTKNLSTRQSAGVFQNTPAEQSVIGS